MILGCGIGSGVSGDVDFISGHLDKMCDQERGKEEETVRVREWNGIVPSGMGV